MKIDPKKVRYDGRSIKLIVEDEEALKAELKEKQKEIIEDLGLVCLDCEPERDYQCGQCYAMENDLEY